MADRNQLEAAILNLVINARDAITGSGDIGVVFTNRTLTEAEALCYGPEAIAPGDYVGIAVTDTGAGMPDNVARQALEPFFTTKAAGAGTGLGLSQTYGFATQSGGTIRITSVQGQGTTVEILLPRAASPVPQQALPQPAAGYQSQGGVIVLAEDDALLRHTVSEVLRSQGYIVETACDGVSALALLNTLPAVDLLLTDVMMPGGMNGVELALSAREVAPELTIMFATGFSDQRLLELWPEALDVINKPFAVDLLISRIESAMTKPKTAAARADYAARVPPDPVG
jgi:CheY-like chemotaxis protein